MNLTLLSLSLSNSQFPAFADSAKTAERQTIFKNLHFSRFLSPTIYISDFKNRFSCFSSDFEHVISSAVVLGSKEHFINNTNKIFITGKKFFYDASPNVFYKCIFKDCNAKGDKRFFSNGGAIQAIMSNELILPPNFWLKISECGFYNCRASGYGGAVCIDSVKIQVNYCIFKNCSSPNGGAFYLNNCTQEVTHFNDTYWSGLHLKDKKNYIFGIAFDNSSVLVNHANFTRVKEPDAVGTFIKGDGVYQFGLQYSFISYTIGAVILKLDNIYAKNTYFKYAYLKYVESKRGIISVNNAIKPMKIVDLVYYKCKGYLFEDGTLNNYVVDNCYIQVLPPVVDDTSSKGLSAALKEFKKLTIGEPNFQVSYPTGANWNNIYYLDKAMLTHTLPFSPSNTFLPTQSFTPSCTLSGILFIRHNKRWYSFRRTVKTIIAANAAPILKDAFDVL